MSNHVSDDSDIPAPIDTDFDTTADDPDAFRIEVTDDGLTTDPPSLGVTLQVGSRSPISLSLTLQSGSTYRGVFHRMVSDDVDDGVLGNQTVLGALRDLVIVRYSRAAGCVEQAVLRIARPAVENDNGTDESRHDVRQVHLNIVVFSVPDTQVLSANITTTDTELPVFSVAGAHSSGFIRVDDEIIEYTGLDGTANRFTGCTRGASGTTAAAHSLGTPIRFSRAVPTTNLAGVLGDIAAANARLAQAGVRIREPVSIDLGPTGLGHPIPGSMLSGFIPNDDYPMTTPNASEIDIIAFKDTIYDSVDVFYVRSIDGDLNGIAYYESYNATGDAAYSNWLVLAQGRIFTTLAHELLHIWLNRDHRTGEPATSLFYGIALTTINTVDGRKRIGPYPAASSSGIGDDDIQVIRAVCEHLP